MHRVERSTDCLGAGRKFSRFTAATAIAIGLLIGIPMQPDVAGAAQSDDRGQEVGVLRQAGESETDWLFDLSPEYRRMTAELGARGYRERLRYDPDLRQYWAEFFMESRSQTGSRDVFTARFADDAEVLGFEYRVEYLLTDPDGWVSEGPGRGFGSLESDMFGKGAGFDQEGPWADYYRAEGLLTAVARIPFLVQTKPAGASIFLVPQSVVDLHPEVLSLLTLSGPYHKGRTEESGLVVDGEERAYRLVAVCGIQMATRLVNVRWYPRPEDQEISIPGYTVSDSVSTCPSDVVE